MAIDVPSPEELAVRAGYWFVSAPVWLLVIASFWAPILWLGFDAAFETWSGLATVAGSVLLGLAAGWAWWSIAAPRWRLWAYSRAADLQRLEQLAVAERLVWPASHPLTRTELRVGGLGSRLRAFEAKMADE